MLYKIHYSCLSHIGNIRNNNQDNFICDGYYMNTDNNWIDFPICGTKTNREKVTFGVFDGLGGEECGEIASYIASKTASTIKIGKEADFDLFQYCHNANTEICNYATLHDVSAMGTTVAMIVFAKKEIVLCNIGDSKIFKLSDKKMKQISKDHIGISAFGVKPPLSQNLGIPPTELIIEPYISKEPYNDGDIYLICSDGLTDMVSIEEITKLIESRPIEESIILLLDKAIENGGKDNITIILCKIERKTGKKIIMSKSSKNNHSSL